uniref:Uncharacterized protein n=1 Tax=Nelumbo nucifera TaxID=4432 RepID=A0A822ZEM4_NELNU|nr:TPA_asm: hypothetical protein HUJ06_001812 [Nelumbo nucifera]
MKTNPWRLRTNTAGDKQLSSAAEEEPQRGGHAFHSTFSFFRNRPGSKSISLNRYRHHCHGVKLY